MALPTQASFRSTPPAESSQVKERRRWYYEVTLIGPSKGTRVGWARFGGAFSRGVCLDVEAGARDGVPKLGYGSDSWGVCGHQQAKSYHRAGLVRAARMEAAAKARRYEHKLAELKSGEDGGEGDMDGRNQDSDEKGEGDGKNSAGAEGVAGDEDPVAQENRSVPSAETQEGEDQEEDTVDSMFLALGGLFRETPFSVDPEGDDGGQVIEQPTPVPPTTIPIPPPPGPAAGSDSTPKEAPAAPSTPPARVPVPPPPPPPPPPLPPQQALRSLADMKLPKSPLSRGGAGSGTSSFKSWGAGAVVGCLADLVAGDPLAEDGSKSTVKMYFFVNGRPINGNVSVPVFSAAVGAPGASAAGTGGVVVGDDEDAEHTADENWVLCPAYSCLSPSDGVSLNLGETPFQYPPDGLIQTLGPGGSGTPADVSGAVSAVGSATPASPSSGGSSTREKRSRHGGSSASGTDRDRGSHPVLARAAEQALETAYSIGQEGRTSPASMLAGGRSEGTGQASPQESGGAGTDVRSPSRSSGETGGSGNGEGGNGGGRGRTKGIPGGVFAVKDAAVSRCVRFDGAGWAVSQQPNLTLQALDVFLVEALIRPYESTTAATGEESPKKMVILSQAGSLGFCFAIEGSKAVVELTGPELVGDGGDSAEGAPASSARHCTPEGVLPRRGTWFKLSAAFTRDTSQGLDQVRMCMYLQAIAWGPVGVVYTERDPLFSVLSPLL